MRALALLAPTLTLGLGCANVLGLRGVSVEHYVGGRVHGLWDGTDGVSLHLQADGVDTLLTVGANGSFKFPDLLAPATSYTVTIMAQPLQHVCNFESGRNGKVADVDVTNIVVACLGPAVTVETSGWDWNFDPTQEVQTFAGSIAMQALSITLTGKSLISASVDGNEVTLGEPTEVTALPLGATTVAVAFTAQGGLSKTYQLVLDRGGALLDQVVYGKASNAGAGDHFGLPVALYQDTLVVGARDEASAATGVNGNQLSNNAPGAGAVYVFVRNGTMWTQQAYLKASNTGDDDHFGSSVALHGDTLAVGAPDEGAVYVFVRNGTAWAQQAYLKGSNTEPLDRFGCSVALYGDTLAVGAVGEASAATGINGTQTDNSIDYAGAAYVFARTGTIWEQQAYLKASNTGRFYAFGYSVGLYEDTLAVGSDSEGTVIGHNDPGGNALLGPGAVYVFVRDGAMWMQQAYLRASNAEDNDLFGSSIALYEDTLVVGAPNEASAATGVNGDQADNSADNAGAVYVFVRSGATWMQQMYLKASNTDAGDNFGRSVALYEDTLAVGAPNEASAATGVNGNQSDDSADSAGAAYVFVRKEATWTQLTFLKTSNARASSLAGDSIALSRDTLVVGASSESSAATEINGNQQDDTADGAGAMYIFR